MTLTVSGDQIDTGEYNFYSVGFRQLIEDHLQYIQNHPTTNRFNLDPNDEYRFSGDFSQLLRNLNYKQDLFWIIMRLNGLHSYVDYAGNLGTIIIPYRPTLVNLLTLYLNSTTIS